MNSTTNTTTTVYSSLPYTFHPKILCKHCNATVVEWAISRKFFSISRTPENAESLVLLVVCLGPVSWGCLHSTYGFSFTQHSISSILELHLEARNYLLHNTSQSNLFTKAYHGVTWVSANQLQPCLQKICLKAYPLSPRTLSNEFDSFPHYVRSVYF